MGAVKYMGHMETPLVCQSILFCVVYIQRASRHHPNIQGASKHTRGVQRYGAHAEIQGAIQTHGASKHTGGVQTNGGFQT